ncbi:MAG: hypothetical protein ABFR35_06825 [Thermodesulfobacteriota bacterium]
MQTYPASEQEAQLTASAFTRYQKIYQDECACCLDAEADATVSVSGWFSNHTGKLSGYLQAMEPGYIKFVALNPLGQPIFIFLTNGIFFKGLNVLEGRAYMGSVNSETFKKFAPPGFDPGFSYFWLTGKLPPGDIEILKVRRDKEQNGYWLQVRYGQSEIDSMILFDPEEFVVLRHIVLNNRGDHLLDLVYGDYQPGYVREKQSASKDQGMIGSSDLKEKFCKIPTKISVSSNSGAEKRIDLKLFSFILGAEFSPDDFELEIPDNLEQLIVN